MSFSFNFNVDACESETQNAQNDEKRAVTPENEEPRTLEAAEITVDCQNLKGADLPTEEIKVSSELSIKVVSSTSVEESLSVGDSDIAQALQSNSDLLPHVYEGGLKIWECSVDLVQYLAGQQIAFRGCNVLELGCGAGLPGLFAYTQGANVTFQDYNPEVLSLVTGPNIHLNQPKDGSQPNTWRLVCGDWTSVQRMLLNDNLKFDFILTSETIYSEESYKKLHDVMKNLLKPTGQIYLAAKTYYFGVGGGTRGFEQYLDTQCAFNHEVCKVFSEGVQREILKLTLKNS